MTHTPPTPSKTSRAARNAFFAATILIVALLTFAVMLLLGNIQQRKHEGQQVVFKIVDLTEETVDAAEWGKNFPRQYDSYRRTVDIERTRHGGSDAFQKLDEDPRWREIFAGYAFSIDYREERGHAYMLSDQRETERVKAVKQPGACLHCHASNIPAYRKVGLENGAPGSLKDPLASPEARQQLMAGFEKVCAMPYDEATKLVDHPVTCLDCHEPGSMQLRVTRPGFLNGIVVLAKSDDPVPHLPSIERWRKGDRKTEYDPNTMASRQELRSMACGQCHVEYYFKGEGKLLTYPWHNGLKMEQAEAYYDAVGFKDWTHKISGAPVLKAQHPEFETWSQGTHARAGVACADCHMPYKREGAIKVSDHHVRSPLLNVAASCQTCHRVPEEELKARVQTIQDRTLGLMDRAEVAVVDLIKAIAAAKEAGATDEALAKPRDLQRKAQWRLDYVAAENSMGFHAPQETARILGEACDLARQGQVEAVRLIDAGKPLAMQEPAGR
ncbi:MAG: ammonia-forming cytochrome c nitrite reductase subunit c552 [Phycisphaeraceae bacterium]|nr:ammonia-forming cytochrome c nitrite reductase subunit c552 [Phycisphaeraceae bacterium]